MTTAPDSSDLATLSDLVGPLAPPTPAQIADARRYIADRAIDAADETALLAAIFGGAA